ncbi:hypothetical protein FRUB_05155 [Fimbriiglobus ruber]|uniref:Uncharacterized protein n=1 Tax=Fimbriiglobus ruber TaxID=1908690 RepID=A0A225DRN8_9BACT|nr:hypothetical protein FRUB_05155 [Fimbriiglobus ruber]
MTLVSFAAVAARARASGDDRQPGAPKVVRQSSLVRDARPT